MRPAPGGHRSGVTTGENEHTGHLSDEEEAAETSSTTDGPAADGEYDPAQGSPHGGAHPVAADYPDEHDRNGDPVGEG